MPRKRKSEQPIKEADTTTTTITVEPEIETPIGPFPVEQPPTFVDRLGDRNSRAVRPDPYTIALDNVAGVRLFENRQHRVMAIKFDEKPAQPIIDMVKEAGFQWKPTDQVWTHPVRGDSHQHQETYMPRKKKPADEATPTDTAAATSVAEPETNTAAPTQVPAWVEGPSGIADAPSDGPADPQAKNWGNPYKAIFASREKGFEMGEHRRFKQRVFLFAENPSEEVLAKLKDNGFTYRANEKAWTIHANPDTRKLSDELAREFAGKAEGLSL